MQTRKFLSQACRELTRHGMIGSNRSALLEEWKDHLQTKTESLLESGHSQEEAEVQACELLGVPEELAELAAMQYHRASWQGRHPWLSAAVIGVALFFISLFACLFVFGAMLEFSVQPDNLSPASLQTLLLLMNWLPWTLGMGWLVWHARRMPAGWKGFWVVTTWVVLCFSSLSIVVSSGGNGVTFNGLPGVLVWAGFHLSGNGSLWVGFSNPIMKTLGVPLLQMFITLGVAACFQMYVGRTPSGLQYDRERGKGE